MARRSANRTSSRKSSQRKSLRLQVPQFLARLWPSARLRKRWMRTLARAPLAVRIVVIVAAVLLMWVTVNWIYQVIRKPSELFFPISGVLHKTPAETWDTYDSVFKRHATDVITADFLAALAQVEGSGNPIVRTYWRWSFKSDPFEVYRPASSAVGMYQFTDGTFAEARHYCIHDHVVVADGPWSDWKSCWFNSLYTRVIATDAVELAAAYLDNRVAAVLRRQRIVNTTRKQKQDLAAVIHLCGAGAGEVFARRGLRLSSTQKCGDHSVRAYVGRVNAMKAVFAKLAREQE